MPETGIHSLTNVGPREAKITNVGMTYGPRKRRRAALISVGIPDIEHPWETLRFVVYTSQGYKKIIQPESDVLQQLMVNAITAGSLIRTMRRNTWNNS